MATEQSDISESDLSCSTTRGFPAGGVTLRAVALALVLVVVLAVAAFHVEVVWYASSVVARGPAVWPLSLLAAAAALPWFRRRGLTRRELLVVYSIVLVVSPLCSRSVLFYLLPKVMLYYHMRMSTARETAMTAPGGTDELLDSTRRAWER